MRSVRWMYALTAPIYPFLQNRFGRFVTSTDRLAAAMLQLAIAGSPKKILNTRELNTVTLENRNRSSHWPFIDKESIRG